MGTAPSSVRRRHALSPSSAAHVPPPTAPMSSAAETRSSWFWSIENGQIHEWIGHRMEQTVLCDTAEIRIARRRSNVRIEFMGIYVCSELEGIASWKMSSVASTLPQGI